MHRNHDFTEGREPAREDVALHKGTIRGPLAGLNPTRANYDFNTPPSSGSPSEEGAPSSTQGLPPSCQVLWNSRDNRKGRHALVIPHDSPLAKTMEKSTSPRAILRGIWRMFTVYPYWDVSWWIAVLFTIGCELFIVSGLFAWLPVAYPDTAFPGEESVASGTISFIGATLFQIGGVMLVFEACNTNRTGCFGWAVEEAFADEFGRLTHKAVHHHTECNHIHKHHQPHDTQNSQRTWEWWPTWHEITTHYIYEIGFLASTSLAIGATIFYVSGILAIPPLYDVLSEGVILGVYYMTYLVGGVIFIVSAVLYILETQQNWYTPAFGVLGWHIGLWNLIGGVGWTCSASFGYCAEVAGSDYCTYQSDLSLIWASVAYTIGSALLWYEALDKYPVVIGPAVLKEPPSGEETA